MLEEPTKSENVMKTAIEVSGEPIQVEYVKANGWEAKPDPTVEGDCDSAEGTPREATLESSSDVHVHAETSVNIVGTSNTSSVVLLYSKVASGHVVVAKPDIGISPIQLHVTLWEVDTAGGSMILDDNEESRISAGVGFSGDLAPHENAEKRTWTGDVRSI